MRRTDLPAGTVVSREVPGRPAPAGDAGQVLSRGTRNVRGIATNLLPRTPSASRFMESSPGRPRAPNAGRARGKVHRASAAMSGSAILVGWHTATDRHVLGTILQVVRSRLQQRRDDSLVLHDQRWAGPDLLPGSWPGARPARPRRCRRTGPVHRLIPGPGGRRRVFRAACARRTDIAAGRISLRLPMNANLAVPEARHQGSTANSSRLPRRSERSSVQAPAGGRRAMPMSTAANAGLP